MGKDIKNGPTARLMDITGEGVVSIALNASYLLAGRWLTISVRFIYAIILTRYLGPELYGYLNYGISWYFAFFPVATVGLGIILIREVGRNRDNSKKTVNQIFTTRFLISARASLKASSLIFPRNSLKSDVNRRGGDLSSGSRSATLSKYP